MYVTHLFGQVKHTPRARGLALLELALILRLVLRVRAELTPQKYPGGGNCVPLGCRKPRLASMRSALATHDYALRSLISIASCAIKILNQLKRYTDKTTFFL